MIGIYKVDEGIDTIYVKNICKFKTEHKDIIVSLSDINNIKIEENDNDDRKIFIGSSSLDCTLRINKIDI